MRQGTMPRVSAASTRILQTMNPDAYLFGIMFLEICDCGAQCRRVLDYDWDDESDLTDSVPLSECPKCHPSGWPRIDDIRFYRP